MAKHNPANERIKREYFAYLKGPRGRDVATIDGVAKSLARFEASNNARDFKKFRREQATSFGERLAACGPIVSAGVSSFLQKACSL